MDQIRKIHNIIGTPSTEKLKDFKKKASHMNINFSQKEGSGIDPLIPHASENCRDLIKKLLIYEEENRLTAREALSHSFFKEIKNEIFEIARTPSISNYDYTERKKNSKKDKNLFPALSNQLKNKSFSKVSLVMHKSLTKNLPNLKKNLICDKKNINKSYF